VNFRVWDYPNGLLMADLGPEAVLLRITDKRLVRAESGRDGGDAP